MNIVKRLYISTHTDFHKKQCYMTFILIIVTAVTDCMQLYRDNQLYSYIECARIDEDSTLKINVDYPQNI